jgi:trk system potassium uptake protein
VVSSTALIADIIEQEIDWACLNLMLSHRLGDVRLKEMQISRHSGSAGKKVADLRLPEGTILISLIRENQVLIPDGQTFLAAGDRVIALTRTDKIDLLAGYFQ